ncbi:substrate-binding domain-containing protein [Acrocarpospora sp. B8E8]|uniref:substrate-binding domain-containing protein n=1 Tax=Acrocarpospora sp. B8E8 TaxID=3153572 RepID=UPI00325F13A7
MTRRPPAGCSFAQAKAAGSRSIATTVSPMATSSHKERPTAIFAADDTLAAGILRAARDFDLTVPGDISVIGFDDGDLAEIMDLTTVRQPLEESGHAAMERLIQQLDQRTAPRDVALGLELIARGTT